MVNLLLNSSKTLGFKTIMVYITPPWGTGSLLVTRDNGSFRSYSRSDPGSFRSYSLSVRSFRPGSFRSDFRGGSFRPNFGGSFRPTLFYIVFR